MNFDEGIDQRLDGFSSLGDQIRHESGLIEFCYQFWMIKKKDILR